MLTGVICKGKQLGKTIDFPTANLHIKEAYKLIPKNGAYIVKANIKNDLIYGMMNVGFNPTVNGTTQSIEIHFFDFNQDLYNQKVQVQLLKRLRDEVKFDSINALKEQLIKDKKTALSFVNKLT